MGEQLLAEARRYLATPEGRTVPPNARAVLLYMAEHGDDETRTFAGDIPPGIVPDPYENAN